MQQIINAIFRNKNALIYLLLLLFAFVFLNNRSYYHQTRLEKLGLKLAGSLWNLQDNTANYFSLQQKNKALLEENRKLRELLTAHPNDTNSISTTPLPGFTYRHARVIKNSFDQARNTLVIDKGARDSIRGEMGIVGPDGIVGIVNETTAHFASALSLLHADVHINAKLKSNDAFGSLYWPGVETNRLLLTNISTINTVAVGDSIVTGGMSDYFPKDIPIGKVVAFKILPSKRYYEIEVMPFTNFTALEHVYILQNNRREELQQLNP